MLERLAERAGDNQTARIARQNRRDEEMMVRKIAANWDTFVDMTLAENGIEAPRRRASASTRQHREAHDGEAHDGEAIDRQAQRRDAQARVAQDEPVGP